MPDPVVSAIVPVYNQKRYLAEAIESILDQDYDNVEIVVVDDGSTDSSAEIARGFDVKLIRQENQGHGGALNTGVAHASGDLLAFLDGDDKWEAQTLGMRVAKLLGDPDLDMTHGMLLEFVTPELESEGMTFVRADGVPTPGLVIGTTLMRAGLMQRVGPFDEDLRLGSVIDWMGRARDLGVRTRMHPEVLVHRRIHDENTTLRSNSMSDYVKLVKRNLDRKRETGTLETDLGSRKK